MNRETEAHARATDQTVALMKLGLLACAFAVLLCASGCGQRDHGQQSAPAAQESTPAAGATASTSTQPATSAGSGTAAGPILGPGNYKTGPRSATASEATANNKTATLKVAQFDVVTNLGQQQPTARNAYLVLSTEWQNTGMEYLVPDFRNHLFVLINGDRQITLSDATSAAPHPLPLDSLDLNGSAVSGQYVFEIPAQGVTSVELLFIDTQEGDMRLALFGHAPGPAPAIAGPVNNGLIETSVLSVKEFDAVGDTQAPAGRKYALVEVRMRALSPGNLVRLDPVKYAMLRDADLYSYPVAALADLDAGFTSETQLLPLLPSRGVLGFLVPVSHSALALAFNLPGYKSVELALPNTGGAAAARGKPVLSIEDGKTLVLDVLGLKRASAIGSATAPGASSYLILDVQFTSKVDDGIEFQTAEQLILVGQDNSQITVDADALDALAHPLKENSWLAPHGQARYEVAYQIPATASHFTLRYRGFDMETKQPLPEVPGAH